MWQIYLPPPKKIIRPRFDVSAENEVHQADLLFLPYDTVKVGRINKTYKYALTLVDLGTMSGFALGYFFLSPPLSPDKFFLRQILKTGAKLGLIFAIFRNSVYTHYSHVGFSMSHLIGKSTSHNLHPVFSSSDSMFVFYCLFLF